MPQAGFLDTGQPWREGEEKGQEAIGRKQQAIVLYLYINISQERLYGVLMPSFLCQPSPAAVKTLVCKEGREKAEWADLGMPVQRHRTVKRMEFYSGKKGWVNLQYVIIERQSDSLKVEYEDALRLSPSWFPQSIMNAESLRT